MYVRAYGAVETHQTSDLRIVGSNPTMLVFLKRIIEEEKKEVIK